MKILHIISDLKPNSGGPPKAALETCQALANEGHEVSLYTTNLTDEGVLNVSIAKPLNIGGVSVFYFPYGLFRKWPVSLQLWRAIRKNIKNFDIVEIHSLYLFHTFITAYFCRKFKTPYIIRPHGSLDPFIRRKSRLKKVLFHFLIENRNLNKANAVHYMSEDEKILAHYPLRIKSPAIVVPLGLNIKEYSYLPPKGTFRAKYPVLVDKTIILFLGRINFKKGLDLLAKAFSQVALIRPNTRLVIAGPEDKGYGNQVRQWLSNYAVLDKTIFTGMLNGREKLAAFVDSDLFVLPSYSENFGIALIEAMVCGLPVITTEKVNIWKEIFDAKAGEIIHCNVDELVKSILELIDNPDLRKKYGENGRELVAEKFNWDFIAKQLCGEYEKIIEQSKKIY